MLSRRGQSGRASAPTHVTDGDDPHAALSGPLRLSGVATSTASDSGTKPDRPRLRVGIVGVGRAGSVLGAAAVGEVPGSNAVAADASPADPGSSERSAVLSARELGVPVLVDSLTTQWSREFALPDGTRRQEVSADPVRVQGSDGVWRDLDLRLARSGSGWVPAVAGHPVVLAGSVGRGGPVVSLRAPASALETAAVSLAGHGSGGGDQVGYAPGEQVSGADAVVSLVAPARLAGSAVDAYTVSYPGPVAGSSMSVQPSERGFSTSVRLSHAAGHRGGVLSARFRLAGVVMRARADGTVALLDAHARLVGRLGSMYLQDAAGLAVTGNVIPVRLSMSAPGRAGRGKAKRAGAGAGLSVASVSWALPGAALAATSVAYPVTAAGMALSLGDIGHDYAAKQFPHQNFSSQKKVQLGLVDHRYPSHVSNAYMRFGKLRGVRGSTVLSASLRLWGSTMYRCAPMPMYVYQLAAWADYAQISWNNQPPLYPAGPRGKSVYAVNGSGAGANKACPAGWIGGSGGFSLDTSLVQGWINGGPVNNGLALRTSPTLSSGFRLIDWTHAPAHVPSLVFTYAFTPGTPGPVSVGPRNAQGEVESDHPVVSVTAPVYPYPAGLSLLVRVLGSLGRSWDNPLVAVSPGQAVTVPVAASLVDDSDYTVQVFAVAAGSVYSAAPSSSAQFAVDTMPDIENETITPTMGTTHPFFTQTLNPTLSVTLYGTVPDESFQAQFQVLGAGGVVVTSGTGSCVATTISCVASWQVGAGLADRTEYDWQVVVSDSEASGRTSGGPSFITDNQQDCFTPRAGRAATAGRLSPRCVQARARRARA